MALEHYIRSGKKMLRCGYTTGTCAALAAAGAAHLLLSGESPDLLRLITPKGIPVEVEPVFCRRAGEAALCAVRKDSGDDPDATDGMLIGARVSRTKHGITLRGGEGIGRVTKPGLDQPVGEAAINSVPRKMICNSVSEICNMLDYREGIDIEIFAPEGEERAQKTFNPQLGIEGGISILGTSGIVEPMSERAIVETTALEIRQAAGADPGRIILLPGNYGMSFLEDKLPELASLPRAKCSNYIGEAIDCARLEGFREVMLVGHIGKLVKLAGGIMNTHSKNADCRRELFCAHAALCGAGTEICHALMREVSSEGCLAVLERANLREPVLKSLLEAIQKQLLLRADGMRIGAILFSRDAGYLGVTSMAEEMLGEWGAPK